jgi:hypothetical protein
MAVTPAHPNDVLVTFEYAPNGLDWARLRDVRLLRWVVDESGPLERRGNLSDFLTWLATNAGAHRQLEKQMSGEGGLFLRGLPWGADACSITI